MRAETYAPCLRCDTTRARKLDDKGSQGAEGSDSICNMLYCYDRQVLALLLCNAFLYPARQNFHIEGFGHDMHAWFQMAVADNGIFRIAGDE
jgi:hypothetical protein